MAGMILVFQLSEVCIAPGFNLRCDLINNLGIRRRGLTVDAISQFMLAQGPSQAVVSLEWDSIWTLNKKIIDPIAPRFWAIVKDKWRVPCLLSREVIVEQTHSGFP
jgi:glutamyl/glutaminyl-tRNA synthetase